MEGDKKVHCPLDVKLDSMLSTKLSYDEISIDGPAIGEGSFGTVLLFERKEEYNYYYHYYILSLLII